MKRNIAFIFVLMLNIMSNPLHAANQEQQHKLCTFPDPELPELIDHDESLSPRLKPCDWLADYFGLPTECNEIRSTPFLIHYMQEKMCEPPACGVQMQFNDMQENKCELPVCSGPNDSVDPLYNSLAKSGNDYAAMSIRHRFKSDGSTKEEITFCGTILPRTQHIEKKE